jgi:hypothetical protein
MTASLRRPLRWSKKTDQLVRHVAHRCRPGLQSELGHWLDGCSRFSAMITAHQDKVRKKLTTANDEESRLDVRAELLVAYLILADRRFEISFEAYGARQLGPDLTVTYRANQRFNLEVTRLRAIGEPGDANGEPVSAAVPRAHDASGPANAEPGPGVFRLANVITGKLRQLPGDAPNALVITTRGLPLSEDSVAAAARLLKTLNDRRDDSFFARRGLRNARDFYAQYLHLGGVFVLDEAAEPPRAIFVPNREARRPLPGEAVAGLTYCFSHPRGTPA